MRWNDSYPFVEPCPGCFENALRAIGELPGNPVFMGNGDFTLSRLLEAVAKLVYKGTVTLVLPSMGPTTLDALSRLHKAGYIERVNYICSPMARHESERLGEYPFIASYQTNVSMYLLSVDNGSGSMMITGIFRQERGSHDVELFTMINDTGQRQAIRKAFESKLHVKF